MTETAWLDDREARAWRALQSLRAPLEAALNRQLARDSGLSTADYSVLVALSEAPDERLRARDLGSGIGWEKSRLSHQIRRMESRGLVDREGCPTDGRGAFIRLTNEGRGTLERAAPGHVAAVRRLFVDALTPDQLDQFAEIGGAVLSRLHAESCGDEHLCGDDENDGAATTSDARGAFDAPVPA